VRRDGEVLPLAAEPSLAQARSSGTIRKRNAAGSHLLVGAVGVAAGMWLGSTLLSHASEASIAMYKRSAALTRACEAAGAEISTLRRATLFRDDCSAPVVTPIFGQEGRVIVSRTVEGRPDDDDVGRVTYSVMLDGRGLDGWRVVEVQQAPNSITLDSSLLPTQSLKPPKTVER
jgi:hypothetical protein